MVAAKKRAQKMVEVLSCNTAIVAAIVASLQQINLLL